MVAKEKIGTVVSDKMLNTRIVAVSDRVSHKNYGKVITRTKRYVAHDIESNSKIGDKVKIQERGCKVGCAGKGAAENQ